MDKIKLDRIKSLNQSETEVLHHLFKDPNFKVRDLSLLVHRGEGGIRTNLTAIFSKLRVPDDVANKREWVFREYSEVYKNVFKRVEGKPEMFIDPPNPIPIDNSEAQPDTKSETYTQRRIRQIEERKKRRQREIELLKERDPNNPEYVAHHNRFVRQAILFVILVLIIVFFLGAWAASTFN